MSDITIEAPKQKRSYTRKPKSEPVPEPVVQQPIPIEHPVEQLVEKPVAIAKRKYTKKIKPEEIPESVVEEATPLIIPSPPELVRQTNEPVSAPEKKPRSDKQIAAFNRMRQARIDKQAELESLREFAKEKEKFDKESAKVEKMEERIVSKAARKPRIKKLVEEEYEPEPQPIVKVSNIRPIMFM